jgi:hypothetical protein
MQSQSKKEKRLTGDHWLDVFSILDRNSYSLNGHNITELRPVIENLKDGDSK